MMTSRVWMVASIALVMFAGCAAELDKGGAADEGDDLEGLEFESAELRADAAGSPFRGELRLGQLEADSLTRRLPYHYWSFNAAAGSQVFIDLASREGSDMFVALMVPHRGGYRVIAVNDDCYSGTLNACLRTTLPDAPSYAVLATTYQYIRRGIPTPANYHVTVHCDDESGCGEARSCGSRGLPECPAGQFCAFADGTCGADDRGGVCQPIPEVCITLYDPVCGCDGRNYSNGCAAANHGISVAYPGECVEENGCQRSGCSRQLCVEAGVDVATTCEWREEYACFDEARCERQDDGRCGWTRTRELAACLGSSGL